MEARKMSNLRFALHVSLLAAVLGILAGCGGKPADSPSAADSGGQSDSGSLPEPANTGEFAPSEFTGTAWPDEAKQPVKPPPNLKPEVVITTSLGEIKVRLDAEKAPVTVENFLANYVDAGFYDETIFHYVDKESLAAAGGYTEDLEPKEAGAQILNEAANGLKNVRGTIAMARLPEYSKSATSQFFFNLVDNPGLDHKSDETEEDYGYCVFGQVIDGLDVLDKIAEAEVRDAEDFPKVPVQAVRIESIRRLK
jgi:peptidyl-prolyl cis-trans isomerase A (cyclophilin A)